MIYRIKEENSSVALSPDTVCNIFYMKVCVCIYGVKLGVLNYVEYFSTEIGAEGILA